MIPAISAPKKPAPKLLPTQAPMAQGASAARSDIGCQKRHHQRQPGHADIKQFFQVRVGGGIGHRALAVQHDGDCQQDPTGHDKRDHM